MQNRPQRPKHQRVLQGIQNVLVIVTALLIVLVILLELFASHAYLFCFAAYLLGALAYGAEIVIIILRAREHMVHKADLVMPVIFGLLYVCLALKYLAGRS